MSYFRADGVISVFLIHDVLSARTPGTPNKNREMLGTVLRALGEIEEIRNVPLATALRSERCAEQVFQADRLFSAMFRALLRAIPADVVDSAPMMKMTAREPPRRALEPMWQATSPTGKVLTCGLYRGVLGLFEVRAEYQNNDLIRSELVRDVVTARQIAVGWKEAAMAKGFAEL